MNNKSLNRAITALDNAGFEIKALAEQNEIYFLGVTDEMVFNNHFKCEKEPEPERTNKLRLPGENFNICRIAGIYNLDDWRGAISRVQAMLQDGKAASFQVGDFLYVSFEVPEAKYDGFEFKKLKIVSAKVVIVEKTPNRLIFNFDEIIFKSSVNVKDTNKGGFSQSDLSKYLNGAFLEAMGIKDYLVSTKDRCHITLPTAYELFGDSEYWEAESNFFDEPKQFNYYESEKNRVKVFENETHWHWTSSARAASSSSFAYVLDDGVSHSCCASAVGGVAPAFCVA